MKITYLLKIFIIILYSCQLSSGEQQKQLSQKLFMQYAEAYRAPKSSHGPADKALISLGKKIFFDTRFSNNGKMGCVSCHNPEMAFSDQNSKAIGNQNKPLKRKSMTLYYLDTDTHFFWDGRADTLEKQFIEALENIDEMNFSLLKLTHFIQNDPEYKKLISKIPDLQEKSLDQLIIKSVVAYIKSIKPPVTAFDRWLNNDSNAMNIDQLKGFELFNQKANCIACHMGYQFKDGLLNDIGLSDTDLGKGALTKKSEDAHMFKTPSLRGISLRAPYMHDGSLKTLKSVIEHYNAPIFKRGHTDIPTPKDQGDIIAFHNFTQPLNLTAIEIEQLVAFLKTL